MIRNNVEKEESMTNENLQNLIDTLNSKDYEGRIFLRQISENVFTSKVYMEKNYPITPFRHITDYFFIRNERRKFIGVVEDRGRKDLHWYITKDSRKKGYLTRALK
ncbi:MAG: hypothetical protein CR965_02350, partial [Paludibacter sp.]